MKHRILWGGWSLIGGFILAMTLTFLKIKSRERMDTFITNDYVVDTITNDFVLKYDTIHINRATTYNAVSEQCDATPLNTADGSRINLELLAAKEIRWVALSRDLIKDEYRDGLYTNRNHWRGWFMFGDSITVYSESSPQINGIWVVHDCMAPKYEKAVDFLFDLRNNNPKLGICLDLQILIES